MIYSHAAQGVLTLLLRLPNTTKIFSDQGCAWTPLGRAYSVGGSSVPRTGAPYPDSRAVNYSRHGQYTHTTWQTSTTDEQ